MAAAAAVALAQSYHSYQEMDCQALIEQAVRNVGGQMDYRGSNDMARNAAWLGTLENARAEGKLAPGALLFIHEDDESGLPARYQGDGFGDFSHVGMYVGENALTDTDKNGQRRECDVVHSSQSMGRVCGSTLQKYALANNWPAVCRALDSWKYAGGRVLDGLIFRRADERYLCETGKYMWLDE